MKSKYFKLHELVDRATFVARGEAAWELIDPRLIVVLDKLKETFPKGTMTVNNWYWGGDRHWSGLRTSDSPYYSKYSQHSFGRAFDAVFSDYKAEEVRKYILDNLSKFPEVGGIELDVSWLHIDVRNTDTVRVFKP